MNEMYDNHSMTGPVTAMLTEALRAPFTKRAWKEFGYALVSFPLAVFGFAFALIMMYNGPTWALSAPAIRKLGAANRFLAWKLLGERVPPPPPLRPDPAVHVRTGNAARLTTVAEQAGGKVRQWMFRNGDGISIRKLSPSRIAELAAAENIPVSRTRSSGPYASWFRGAALDKPAWRTRIYIAAKLPLAACGLAVAAGCYFIGLYFFTYPLFGKLADPYGSPPVTTLTGSLLLVPLGAALFFAAPWLMRGVTEPDRWLVRNLLGPTSLGERVRELEETRSIAVDDAAARLRVIERDLHDGAQAQLVAVAMKLGLAQEKLTAMEPVDLERITQLVNDAHGTAVEAIAELRTIVRGIHPPVLDKGLADALATLANRSAVPVELITDIPDRPTDAIETIAYFSAAELLANVARHSGARSATLEAVHVPGLLRIRVTDDGHGGARAVPDGGLRGLAERVRTVDGHLDIESPPGGPTTITVELPSRA